MRTRVDPLWLSKERDLFCRLLQLGERANLEPFLQDALALVVEMTHATVGYIELFDDAAGDPPRWWQARGCSERDVRDIRALISRGIVAEALATGETVYTEHALEDVRFAERESVRRHGLQSILCAPVGWPPVGVVYLQGGEGGRFTTEDSRRIAELFARHLAPLASRLLARTSAEADPTAGYRARLDARGLVGRSHGLAEVLHDIEVIRSHDLPVLVHGAPGTGKTRVARVIAGSSRRAAGPLIVINCAALPGELVDRELFGVAEPGGPARGKLLAADRGTVVLKHVGELSRSAQERLAAFLENGQYCPVGSSECVTADVRVVATTSIDLEVAGDFCPGLLYRLRTVSIGMPPLSERVEDIEPLCRWFCRVTCERHGFEPLEVSPWAVRSAECAEWPGNVRQLVHAVEAAVIRAHTEGARAVKERHFFPTRNSPEEKPEPLTLEEALQEFKRRLVLETLERADWNVREAARQLGIARSQLYNLIAVFGLRRESEGRRRSIWN